MLSHLFISKILNSKETITAGRKTLQQEQSAGKHVTGNKRRKAAKRGKTVISAKRGKTITNAKRGKAVTNAKRGKAVTSAMKRGKTVTEPYESEPVPRMGTTETKSEKHA